MGLLAADEPFVVEPLTGGVSSNVLVISTGERRLCLKQALPRLKVAKEWLVPISRIYAEIDWLTTVATIEPTLVPAVLGVDRAAGCFAMEFLAPAEHPNWKARLMAGSVDPAFAGLLGDRLGRIHAATARRPELAATFATDADFHALRLDPYLLETARNHPDLAARLEAVVETTRTTKLALVHGDVSPKNILIGPRGPVLLDAECAWWGDPAFDLAFCLNHLLLKAAVLPAVRPALFESFRRLTAAHLAHVDWEPVDALEARAAALLACLLLARVDGKSPAEYLDAGRRDLVRAAARPLIAQPPVSLAAVATHLERIVAS
ncbi:aminoglycoside phosphotransferase family protein [Siculibacillus lacustris]|uniref:Aminoglycoside phosphotransferase family protein n=2 Tax=Siculibacillus lacustris TaxID=1549641 RepID=A0A4Q9VTV9_9HYPH|nr:aminoglycoside phosphotransferase family protein [Siculibacillus lacustris]